MIVGTTPVSCWVVLSILLATTTLATPTLRILWPPTGHLVNTSDVRMTYAVDGPFDGFVRLSGSKVKGDLAATSDSVFLSGTLFGSYWASAQLVDSSHRRIGPPAMLHFERILSHAEAHMQRQRQPSKQALVALPAAIANRPTQRRLCFVTSTTQLDGQLVLWLELMRSLQQHSTSSYSFHVFETCCSRGLKVPQVFRVAERSAVFDPFRALGVPVTFVHLKVVDGRDVAAHGLTNNKTMEQLTAYAAAPSAKAPHYIIQIWKAYTDALAPCQGAVMLYANSQDYSDPALSLVGRHVGVHATVLELSSVGPMPHTVDAVVGPSQYAAFHPSVARAIVAHSHYVISPGVDTDMFTPAGKKDSTKCLIVGYLGRVAAEKSLGLLASAIEMLMAAESGRCFEFRWVGDGPDIDYYRRFPIALVGGIYNKTDLVRELQSWDIAVHPGLRETFCI
ncbi:hypothetical protein ACHHYP_13355, partial [Achlya hypogyna]